MKLCDLTLSSPQENLACDEALLDSCELTGGDDILRFWEPAQYFVVLGYANKVRKEVNLPFCQQNSIPLLRRCTGGGTVLQGPGVLNYSLILRADRQEGLHTITGTNQLILQRNQEALTQHLGAKVEIRGDTDMAIGGLKFAGNAQRRRKNYLLFHGSLLLRLDPGLVNKALPMPSKQPEYRLNRSHADFLLNLNVPPHMIKAALSKAWNASAPFDSIPFAEISTLANEKYSTDEWNYKF